MGERNVTHRTGRARVPKRKEQRAESISVMGHNYDKHERVRISFHRRVRAVKFPPVHMPQLCASRASERIWLRTTTTATLRPGRWKYMGCSSLETNINRKWTRTNRKHSRCIRQQGQVSRKRCKRSCSSAPPRYYHLLFILYSSFCTPHIVYDITRY